MFTLIIFRNIVDVKTYRLASQLRVGYLILCGDILGEIRKLTPITIGSEHYMKVHLKSIDDLGVSLKHLYAIDSRVEIYTSRQDRWTRTNDYAVSEDLKPGMMVKFSPYEKSWKEVLQVAKDQFDAGLDYILVQTKRGQEFKRVFHALQEVRVKDYLIWFHPNGELRDVHQDIIDSLEQKK